jgi:hypothetical protein
MSIQIKWRNHFQEHKTLFLVLAVGLFLVELEIFAMAAMTSGRESRLQVLDQRNNVVYEAKSATLDTREKSTFEKTFGPLSNYQINVVTTHRPFPFRPWFAAAVGLPIGAVLLFGFFIKAYEALFFRTETGIGTESQSAGEPGDRLGRLLTRVGRMSIFAIGGFVLVFVLGLWAIPQLLSEFGRHGVAVIVRYKWAALGVVAVFLGIVLWIIYLRFLLARRAIEAQADVEKYRLQLEMMGGRQVQPRLTATDHPRLELSREPSSPSSGDEKDKRPAS